MITGDNGGEDIWNDSKQQNVEKDNDRDDNEEEDSSTGLGT